VPVTAVRTDTVAASQPGGPQGRGPHARGVAGAYLALTKPRIVELLLVTTIPVMFLAAGCVPGLWNVVATLIGGTLAAGSANALNCVVDADIDELMRRTRRRPLPQHSITPGRALVFGLTLGLAATLVLGLTVNWLSAGLALTANAFYVIVYSMVLKRRTSQNIVWGGAAGCFPTLIGWTAVTGRLSWAPVVLFMVVFLWTPPHFWALAMRYRDDYAAADVPMLPVVMSERGVTWRIVLYTCATVACSLLLWPVAHTGWLYPLVAIGLGIAFIVAAQQLHAKARSGVTGTELGPMRLFHFSNLYLALLFLSVALDPLLR